MKRFSVAWRTLSWILLVLRGIAAFSLLPASKRTSWRLNGFKQGPEAPNEAPFLPRRNFLASVAASFPLISHSQPSHATYSAYTRREQDWESRQKEGNVTFSSAKSLRKQLRDIAPMNSEGSKIFCPNGPSSNVSPLMENKCDDRPALFPSVYGRTEDSVGNSIPGFAGGRYGLGDDTSTVQAAGGFPSYK
jgi:hypothetical protein